jgi:hypothetical protein
MRQHLPQIHWLVLEIQALQPQHQMPVMTSGHQMPVLMQRNQIHQPRQRQELKLVFQKHQLRSQKNSQEKYYQNPGLLHHHQKQEWRLH